MPHDDAPTPAPTPPREAGPTPSPQPVRKSGNATAFGCLVLLTLLAWWAIPYHPPYAKRGDPKDAIPWLITATVVFGVRTVLERLRK